MPRRTSIAAFTGICLAAVTTSALIAGAHATTGVGTGLPQPRVDVAQADGEQFTGRYAIGEIDRRAKITSGQLMVEYTDTEKPFLIGSLAIYGYDSDGRQQTSSALTYPFSYGDGVLSARVISQGTYRQIGSLRLPDPRDPDELPGTLGWRGGSYQIVLDRLPASDLETPLPQAKQVDLVPLRLKNRGLGPRDEAFYGRWELVPSRADTARSASLYAPLVRAATAIGDDAIVADSGHLVLFEVESRFDPPAPGGMMTLHAPGSTRAEFLTDFRWQGPWRTAVVRGGSDEGPVVGRFTGRISGDTLVGTLRNGDLSIELTFARPKQRR
jgi:hypothetical protein